MKKDRSELNTYFEKITDRYIDDPKKKAEIQSLAEDKYGIPPFRVQTILQHDAAVEECSNIELFWLLSCIYEWKYAIKNEIPEFFTDSEIKLFSGERYEKDDIQWPLEFNVFQIAEDQWIGKISAELLTKMRKNNLLRYNKNIQRRVKTIVKGNNFYDSIDLNKTAVKSIERLIKTHKFIPNTITLNFDYDNAKVRCVTEKYCTRLIFDKIDHLDILDGYHRFVAISRVIDDIGDIDLELEIRFTCYSDDKANQFIWQEEQKTRVPKKDVKTYNMDDISNKIVKRVNESSSCNLSGKITRSGHINSGTFAEFIDRYYISRMSEEEKETAIIKVSRELIECINLLTENDLSMMTKKYTIADTRVLTFVCSKFYDKPKDKLVEIYNRFTSHESIVKNRTSFVNSLKAADRILENVFLEVNDVL